MVLPLLLALGGTVMMIRKIGNHYFASVRVALVDYKMTVVFTAIGWTREEAKAACLELLKV